VKGASLALGCFSFLFQFVRFDSYLVDDDSSLDWPLALVRMQYARPSSAPGFSKNDWLGRSFGRRPAVGKSSFETLLNLGLSLEGSGFRGVELPPRRTVGRSRALKL